MNIIQTSIDFLQGCFKSFNALGLTVSRTYPETEQHVIFFFFNNWKTFLYAENSISSAQRFYRHKSKVSFKIFVKHVVAIWTLEMLRVAWHIVGQCKRSSYASSSMDFLWFSSGTGSKGQICSFYFFDRNYIFNKRIILKFCPWTHYWPKNNTQWYWKPYLLRVSFSRENFTIDGKKVLPYITLNFLDLRG